MFPCFDLSRNEFWKLTGRKICSISVRDLNLVSLMWHPLSHLLLFTCLIQSACKGMKIRAISQRTNHNKLVFFKWALINEIYGLNWLHDDECNVKEIWVTMYFRCNSRAQLYGRLIWRHSLNFIGHHHHKHQGLGPLIRSVSRVTAARANASLVFQLFSFLVVYSGMISKGFSFVAFFASVKASSLFIYIV